MTKKALVVIAGGFEEIEAVTCIDVLRRADIEVTVAGLGKIDIKGAHDIKVTADISIDNADDNFDALVIPGGMPGAANLASSEKVNELIKKFNTSGKIIAAICASPAIVLAPAGVLEGKKATCYPGLEEKFTAGVKYIKQNVVVDSNIITSQGPATAMPFALKITENLSGSDTAESLASALLF